MPVYGLHAQRIQIYEKKAEEKRLQHQNTKKLSKRLSRSHLDLNGLNVPGSVKQSRSHCDLANKKSNPDNEDEKVEQALYKQLARNEKMKQEASMEFTKEAIERQDSKVFDGKKLDSKREENNVSPLKSKASKNSSSEIDSENED